ncbi:unnamed protein product [Brachionus calyciflorus]|uniref:Uncharacterized protein n=1 Tax=Brachionus calyciflorus TaxID=104777 RepID=A0A814JGP5_9BILA|nr:unnamed protein product [Brachionus calyciflorus]
MPIVREHAFPIAKSVGKLLFRTATNVAQDTLNGNDPKESVKHRLKESIRNISEKIHQGEGFILKPGLNINRNEAGQFDNIKFSLTDDEKKWKDIPKMNTGLLNRKTILSRGNGKIELIGSLHCDIFNSDRYLINNVSMNLKLIPNRPEFPNGK